VDSRALFDGIWDDLDAEGFSLVLTGTFPEIETAAVPLRHVLMNIIGNAIKHHDGKGVIRVLVHCSEHRVEFSITDDGPGIPPDLIDRAFEPFQTLKSRDDVEGSGLGLSLARRLVESAGGQLTALSPVEAGRGTQMRFTWPLVWEASTGEARR
jgi:hypothetical protein